MGVKAVVFDLDDTLCLERDYAFSGFDAVAAVLEKRLDISENLAPRMRALFDSEHRARVFDKVIEECGIAGGDTLVQQMIETFRAHLPTIRLCPDADAALSRLRGKVRLGLISDGFSVAQHNKIDALELHDRIDEIIVTDDWGRAFWKPHVRAFEEMAKRLGVGHAECVYVADNPAKDFVAPRALGWSTVSIKRPGAVHIENDPPEGGEPGRTITTLDEFAI